MRCIVRSNMPEVNREFYNALPQGVGAALTINANTRIMSRFLDNLPPHLGVPIPGDSVHMTVVDANETHIPVYSDRDLIALRNAGSSLHRRLAALPLESIALHPGETELQPYGRYLAIDVQETPFLQELRGGVAEQIKEDLGVEIIPTIDWHISVLRVARARVKARGSMPRSPKDFHIRGFDIQRRLIDENHRPSRKQRYKNTQQTAR